ncbi:MAG: hypothetical protein V1934_02030 [Methanobacteriota archaeon]
MSDVVNESNGEGGSMNSCHGPCDHGLPPGTAGIMIIIGPWAGNPIQP